MSVFKKAFIVPLPDLSLYCSEFRLIVKILCFVREIILNYGKKRKKNWSKLNNFSFQKRFLTKIKKNLMRIWKYRENELFCLIDHLSMVWERAEGRCLSLASALKTFERVEQQPNGLISLVPTRPPIQNVFTTFPIPNTQYNFEYVFRSYFDSGRLCCKFLELCNIKITYPHCE